MNASSFLSLAARSPSPGARKPSDPFWLTSGRVAGSLPSPDPDSPPPPPLSAPPSLPVAPPGVFSLPLFSRLRGCDLPHSAACHLMHLLRSCTILLALTASLLAAEKRRPNILFIVVDDQSPFDLKAYNPKSTLRTLDSNAARALTLSMQAQRSTRVLVRAGSQPCWRRVAIRRFAVSPSR